MNKRLLLALYDRSGLGAYLPVDYNGHELEVEKHMEKFAELVVRECAQVCINLQDIPATEPRHCAEDIKIHFGVE